MGGDGGRWGEMGGDGGGVRGCVDITSSGMLVEC